MHFVEEAANGQGFILVSALHLKPPFGHPAIVLGARGSPTQVTGSPPHESPHQRQKKHPLSSMAKHPMESSCALFRSRVLWSLTMALLSNIGDRCAKPSFAQGIGSYLRRPHLCAIHHAALMLWPTSFVQPPDLDRVGVWLFQRGSALSAHSCLPIAHNWR